MIRPWVFEFFPQLTDEAAKATGRTVTDHFAGYLQLWSRDEELDFEGIFFSEHHFGYSFSPSPHLLIAATAMRTRRLRLGVMGVVVPYYPPSRIIEEIGMLDHLTGGRLEIGTAIGVPQELARLGLSMDAARAINDEALDILDAALATGVVDHKGKHFQYDNLRLLPPVAQRPSPPKWTTVVSPDSARRAARRRTKICTGFNTTEEIKALFDAYRDEAAACGIPAGPGHLGLRRRVVVAESEAQARALTEAMAERLKGFVASDPRVRSSVPDAPQKPGGGFSLTADEFISGTPDQVAETIIGQCRRIGAENFLAVLHWGAQLDEVAAAHELFGREVIPRLRQTELAPPSGA